VVGGGDGGAVVRVRVERRELGGLGGARGREGGGRHLSQVIRRTTRRYQPELAGALNNLGAVLRHLRRYEDALAAQQDAVDLYRQLAAQPGRYQPDLAHALRNLGTTLHNLGRYEEELAKYQESLTLMTAAARDQPRYGAEAMALDRLIRTCLIQLGREEESIKYGLSPPHP